jgi:hypothetical protein
MKWHSHRKVLKFEPFALSVDIGVNFVDFETCLNFGQYFKWIDAVTI